MAHIASKGQFRPSLIGLDRSLIGFHRKHSQLECYSSHLNDVSPNRGAASPVFVPARRHGGQNQPGAGKVILARLICNFYRTSLQLLWFWLGNRRDHGAFVPARRHGIYWGW